MNFDHFTKLYMQKPESVRENVTLEILKDFLINSSPNPSLTVKPTDSW